MLDELKSSLSDEKNDGTIFDVVLYGSAVKGKEKPSDLDIAVIFRTGSLKERLEKIQKIKHKIKTDLKLDVKAVLLEELFQSDFFARSGIFVEGVSLFDGKDFANKIGFDGHVLFVYSLKNKSHTEKVKFNYIMKGRKTQGLRAHLNAHQLAPGVLSLPIASSEEFEEILKKHNIDFSKKYILEQL